MLEMDFSKCDFPVPYSDPAVVTNWFDFNDSSVEPIMPGTLQKMFGGSSANAYMLVYRQRRIAKHNAEQPSIPEYWRAEIERINQADEEFRAKYDTLKNQFEMILQDS